jgi:amino acid adenylation domain-containing protein/non-ribosomal peptide synthase protein (TIGR01720 family)
VLAKDQQLIAYVVWHIQADKDIDSLLGFLQSILPYFMVPNQVVSLAEMPLTANGKINRKALLSIEPTREGEEVKLPQHPLEMELFRMWSQLLRCEKLGIDTNFFHVGGHSLLATQLLAWIKRKWSISLQVKDLFAYPTIEQLAKRIAVGQEEMEDPIEKRDPTMDRVPLSYTQQRLWFLDRYIQDKPDVYHVPAAFRITGAIDRSVLQWSLQQVVARHEVLRTVIVDQEGRGEQVVQKQVDVHIEEMDLQSWGSSEREKQIEDYCQQQIALPFSLEKGPLWRISLLRCSSHEAILLLVIHHMIADGWAIQLFMRDLLAFYQAYPQASSAELPSLPVQYADYALWERQRSVEERFEDSLAYWREQLGDQVPVLALPTDQPRPPVQSYRGDTYQYSLSKELTERLHHFCRKENVTLFMALMTAWTVLLHRYSGQNDICVGTPVANRQRKEIEQLIGSFVNTLVLRIPLDSDATFGQLLQQVREVALDAFAHQEVPFERLLDELNIERDLSISPLFQVMFVLQNAPISFAEQQQDIQVKPLSLYGKTAKYDLTLFVTEYDDHLEWVFEYATDLFSRQTVERMMAHFAQIVEQMIDSAEQSVSQFPLLTQAEKERLDAWSQTPALCPPAHSVVRWFEEQVFKMPERMAIEDIRGRYTYSQLNQQANQLAHHLRTLGVRKESLVGICLSRTSQMVVAMLAVLKAGGAYVPFDPAYPEERIHYMVQDAEVKVILTEQAYTDHFASGPTLVLVDQDEPEWVDEPVTNLGVPIEAEQLAYVIYTSGSTGQPKGVMIEHRNVLALLAWAKEEYSEEDIMGTLASTSICFDLSIFEIFFPLCCGGKILLAENALVLPELPYRDQVTLINTVPSAIAELLRKQAIPKQTRVVNLAGEPLAQRLVEQIYALGTVERVYNLYGPSEDTTYSTCARLKKKLDASPSIGYPIAGTKVHVLDRHMQPVPIGVVGECYLSGAGLSRGYLKKPELTAERFVYLPSGERLYRTGDLVRYRANGELEFLGRTDFQVKIRGFRIELGEIEERLRRHPQVEEAVVVPYEGAHGKQLVAYLQMTSKEEEFVDENYRLYLQRYLPTYMIPNLFHRIKKLPLTPNGKIDRGRLPKPQPSPRASVNQRGPLSESEAVLSAAWKRVLRLTSLSRDDHFFELGGDSILILQVIAKCKAEGWRLTPQQFFAYPRIAQLSRVMQKIDQTDDQATKVSGRLQLTPIQHWFFEQEIPNPHNWNQSMLFRLTGQVDPERLQQAFLQLIDHHDALRLRFWQTEGWQAEFCEREEKPFFTYEQQQGDPQNRLQELHQELEDSLRIDKGPLLRVKVVAFPERNETYLLWVIHHLVIDGVSWRILLSDLEQAYWDLQAGQAVKLPAKTTSYQQWGEILHKAAKTEKQIAEREYWLKQKASTPLPLDYPMGMNTDTLVDTVDVSCSEEESHLLLTEVPKHYRAKIMELFLAALSDAFFAWTGQTKLLVHLESHGREWPDEQVDLSQTVGWFTSIYPILLTADRNQRLGQTLSLVKERLRQVPNQGIGFGVLRYLVQDEAVRALPEAKVSFNYLGQFDQLHHKSQLIDQVIGFYGPSYRQESRRAHLIDVTGMIVAGKIQWSWLYSRALFNRETIQRFADHYLQALRRFVEQHKKPDVHSFNPSDFPQARLDRSELNKVLSKISQRKD